MDQNLKKDSLELLTKESERYRLERLGFFRDIREEAELLASFLRKKTRPSPSGKAVALESTIGTRDSARSAGKT